MLHTKHWEEINIMPKMTSNLWRVFKVAHTNFTICEINFGVNRMCPTSKLAYVQTVCRVALLKRDWMICKGENSVKKN
jgi:hypothetical protein